MKTVIKTVLIFTVLSFSSIKTIYSQSFTEGFTIVNNTLPAGWAIINNSDSPSPTFGWAVGNPTTFTAQAGANNSYLSCGFQSTTASTGATISNWLLTPTRVFNNGDQITFYTRAHNTIPDRLEIRLSTSGNSSNVGTTSSSVGDYTNLLLSINPSLTSGGYPTTWALQTITISGLSGPTVGRVAFRYFVTNAGSTAPNSNYIGIDTYTYTSTLPAPVNDNCAGATDLVQGATCSYTTANIAGATASTPATTCGGTANEDVWFKFQATAASAKITVDGSAGFDAVFGVYSGACGSLTNIGCTDYTLDGGIETNIINGLTIGQTYFIRVYDWYDMVPSTIDFNICVEQYTQCTLTQPVGSITENEVCSGTANDSCSVAQTISCGDVIWGKIWSSNVDWDVDWYKFAVTNPANVSFNVKSEVPVYIVFLNIANCASATQLASIPSNDCNGATLTYNFTSAGTYAAVIVPQSLYSGFGCGTYNDYIATLTMNTTTPTITAGGPTTFCQGGSVTLTASAASTYQWNDVNGPINGQTGNTYTANAAGSYTVTTTDGNGCSATSTATAVTVNPIDNATFSYGGSTFCVTGSNPVPTVNTTGTFSASPAGLSFVSTSTGEVNLASTTPNTYTITYTTTGTCPTTSTQTLTVTTSPSASFSYNNTAYCVNATDPSPVLAVGSSAGTFSAGAGLSINATTGVIDLSASTASTYTVTNSIPASGGCAAASATFDVTVNALPTITFAPASVCESAPSFTLTATPIGGTFSGTGVTGSTFDPSAGTQTVTYSYTDGNNCTATANALITATPSTDDFSYAQTDYCEGSANATPTVSGVGTFSASSTDLVFVSTSSGEIDIAGSEVGSYTVTFTSTGSCPNVVTRTLNIVQAISADFSYANSDYCLNSTNATATLASGAVAGTFTSSTGLVFADASTGAIDFVASTAGSYTITNTVSASGVCPAETATFDITVHALPTVTLTGGGAICIGSGDAVDITLTATGTGPWNVIVNNGIFDIPLPPIATSPETSQIDENGAGTYNLVSVTDAYCTNIGTGSVTVTVNPLPVITVNNIAVCEDATPFTLDNATPVSGTYSGTGVTAGQFDPAVGTQTISYEYTDANGCVGTGTGTVTVNTLPTVTFAPASVCDGNAPFTPTASPASGSFSGTGVTANQFDPAAGTQTITYNFTDGNNCSASASALITVLPRPTASITGGGGTFCQGASTNVAVALTGSSPWELVINNGTNNTTVSNITSSPYNITASASGTYTIATVSDVLCSNAGSGSAVVTVNPLPTVVFPNVAVCDDVTNVTLSATPLGGTYTGTGVTGNQFNTQSGTQNVTYTFTNANNCSGSATATITVNESPTVTLSLPQMVCVYGTSFALTGESPAGGTYFGNGITGNTFNPAAAGLGNQFVNYTYTNSDNCSTTAIANITVSQCLDINESGIENTLFVYPNPAADVVNFKFSAETSNVLIKIMSTEGKTVYQNQFQSNQVTVDVNTFARGIYFVNITVDGKVYTSKIVLN